MPILCATDFSEASMEATAVAAALARRLSKPLVLAHVVELPAVGAAGLDAAAALEYRRILHEGAGDALDDAAAPLRAEGLSVETRLLEGSAAGSLAELATEIDAELVVAGSIGHGAVERLVVGSVTERLSRLCDRPLLAVRGETAGFTQWATGARPLRVVVGLDRSSASAAALDLVRLLRRAGPVDLTFIHAYWPPVTSAGPVSDEAARAGLEHDLEARIGELPGEGKVEVKVWPTLGNLGFNLDRWAEERQADLVLVGSHRRSLVDRLWRGGNAHGTLHHVRTSVLCAPLTARTAAHSEPVPRLHRVLVATDLSPSAGRAVRTAYSMVGEGAEVHLAHVASPGELDGDAQLERERALAALTPRGTDALGIRSEPHVLESDDVASALAELADEIEADVLVVGARGASRLAEALLGSTAERVMRRTERPVLVVHTPRE